MSSMLIVIPITIVIIVIMHHPVAMLANRSLVVGHDRKGDEEPIVRYYLQKMRSIANRLHPEHANASMVSIDTSIS